MQLLGRKKYKRMKENVRNVSEKQENMRLNSEDFLKNNEFANMWWVKNYRTFYAIKNFYFIFCVSKMYLISAKGYENAGVRLLIEIETGIIWLSMKNVQNGLDVQSISDLVLQEIHGIYKTKNPAIDQI